MSDTPSKPAPAPEGKQPSPQAIEILAKMMVNKAKREGKLKPKPKGLTRETLARHD
jgi:hypothetical protein